MKYLLLITSFITTIAFGQIEFKHLTLAEGKALAKKENKPLFVDVFAIWCGPCKYMANTTFKDPAIGEYYNKNFICIKVDGEKEDGPSVMSTYQITAYPTLLYFNPNGELATTFVGGMDVPTMKRLGVKVFEPQNDPVLLAGKAYHASKKEKMDLVQYILVLNENADDSLVHYAEIYYKKNPKIDFKNTFEWIIFDKAENNFQSENAKAFLSNINSIDPKAANDKMVNFILMELETSKQTKDFSNCEKAIRLLYPSLVELNVINLPELEDLVTQLRNESEAAW
jgi:thiol-disulfide isomerase/thioredoxin